MTLANKITVLRILAIPVFVITLYEHHLNAARGIFLVSVISDALDGGLARIRGEQSRLGSFLDPVADKLLLMSTFVAFTSLGWVPVWIFITVISRDLLIVLGWSVVFILTGYSKVEPRILGKATTALQMIVALARLFDVRPPFYTGLLYTMILCTIVSALDYIWIGNKRLGSVQ
jgi:cardiolipin synthase